MCLRRLSESMASQGHYPSEAMKGSPSQTELQCSDCNSAMNYQYEHAAQDFFTRQWDVGFGPKGGGQIQFKAEVVTENGVLRIRSRGMSDKAKRTLDQIMARAPEPRKVEIHIKEPAEHVAKRALLAWSFLGWFHYAGYAYAASVGAMSVRRIILDPTQALPATVVYSRATSTTMLPFPVPEPTAILLSRDSEPITSPEGVAAYLGLGMWWRSLVTVLPFANDENGQCWERVARVAALGQTQRVREMNLRVAFKKVQPRGLRDEVVIENTETGEILEMTHRLSDDEVRLLVAGQSPFRLDPPRPL